MELRDDELITIFIRRCHVYCSEFCTELDETTEYTYNGKTYIIFKSDLYYIKKLIERLGG